MGTTLTGTEIKDTYDSLIKVTDNGPISGTAKYLSDGLGNDSVLALSTTAVGVGTTSNSYTSAGRGNLNIAGSAGAILGFQIGGTPKGYVFHDNTTLQLWNEVAGDLLFGTNATERMRITSAGNVGIGTSSPAEKLSVAGAIITTGAITGHGANRVSISQEGANGAYLQSYGANTSTVGAFTFRQASSDFSVTQIPLAITASGNVGIGTSSPTGKLTVSQANSGGVAAILLTEDESTIQGPSANTYLKMGGNMTLGAAGIIPIQIATTEVLRVTANGLTFNGDTAAANALDDYEEGTFTPTIEGSSTAGTANYVERIASYTKIGRIVHFAITMNYNSGTGTGDLRISNLPFTSANEFTSVTIGAFSNVSLTAGYAATSFIAKSVQAISFEQYPTGGGTSIPVPYDAEGIIFVTGSYSV